MRFFVAQSLHTFEQVFDDFCVHQFVVPLNAGFTPELRHYY